jgi:hypothetical protein
MQYDRILGKEFCCYGHFKKLQNIKGYYRTLIQCFAVFKEINRWNYVSDPKTETIATASESLSYFSGDCDDHSILMAASVMRGTPRLILKDIFILKF